MHEGMKKYLQIFTKLQEKGGDKNERKA